jgi:uncharacterized membrane protein
MEKVRNRSQRCVTIYYMKPSRFDNFSDGIFAIILTFLAFELRIPQIVGIATEGQLIESLIALAPVFLSFILSFALVYTYWRAHHFIASVYAKSIDRRITTINAFFFFFICTIPFSARLLGEYGYTKTAIWVYGLNIILVSLSLIWMRSHVFSSGNIDHARVNASERRRGAVRLLLPLLCAVVAIVLCYFDTRYSILFFTIAVLFNILPGGTRMAEQVIGTVQEKVSHLSNKSEE